jgi:hypothetical protein
MQGVSSLLILCAVVDRSSRFQGHPLEAGRLGVGAPPPKESAANSSLQRLIPIPTHGGDDRDPAVRFQCAGTVRMLYEKPD